MHGMSDNHTNCSEVCKCAIKEFTYFSFRPITISSVPERSFIAKQLVLPYLIGFLVVLTDYSKWLLIVNYHLLLTKCSGQVVS
jgi:hypothetical protein